MPNPLPGDGRLTFTQGQVVPVGVMYMAPYVEGDFAPPPGARLGLMEPAAPYQKMPLMTNEIFTINEPDPQVLEYRRGFRQRYYGEVVKQAAIRTIECNWDEVEPLAVCALTGETPTPLGSSPNTGRSLDVGSSEYYYKTLLIVYQDPLTMREYQMFNPMVLARYAWAKNNDFLALKLTIKLIPFLNASNKYKDIQYFEFDGLENQTTPGTAPVGPADTDVTIEVNIQ